MGALAWLGLSPAGGGQVTAPCLPSPVPACLSTWPHPLPSCPCQPRRASTASWGKLLQGRSLPRTPPQGWPMASRPQESEETQRGPQAGGDWSLGRQAGLVVVESGWCCSQVGQSEDSREARSHCSTRSAGSESERVPGAEQRGTARRPPLCPGPGLGEAEEPGLGR